MFYAGLDLSRKDDEDRVVGEERLLSFGVRPVGTVERIGDLDPPAGELELVVNETGAVHRLDRGIDGLAVAAKTSGQTPQAVGVRGRRAHRDRLACRVEQAEVETLARTCWLSSQHRGVRIRVRACLRHLQVVAACCCSDPG